MQSTKLNKLRTILSVPLLLFIIFAVIFPAAETEHESHCTEDNCPICFVIQIIKTNLGGLILASVTSVIVRHFVKSKKIAFSSLKKSYISNTLFSLKIRLND